MVTMALLSRSLLLLLTTTSITSVHSLATPNTNTLPRQQQPHHAVVVGAGPVGMATALILATHHNYSVSLLESSPPSSAQTEYDPTKAFLYNVNGRGQTLTKQFPKLQQKLEERSVSTGGFGGVSLTIVPADPNVEIPIKPKQLRGGDPENEGESSEEEKKEEEGNLKSSLENEKAAAKGYWIPRHEMVKLMAECVEEHNAQSDNNHCKIDFLMGQECIDILPSKKVGQDNNVCVKVRNVKDGSLNLHQATLVVGADGMNSKVRECIASAHPNTWQSHKGFQPKKFTLKQWTSPASHLRIKVLQLPPQFQIPNAPGLPPLITNGPDMYALRSVNTGPRTHLSLGLLPMKDNTAVRPTNIVTRPDHEVWDIHDGPTMQGYFQKAYPRFNFGPKHKNGMISEQEWDRFAKAQGTKFPYCQYSEGLAVWDESGTCGVALVGDAIHAFPPDIGQGVNAGLMDVVCLDRALSGLHAETGEEMTPSAADEKKKKKPALLMTNLEQYQKQHMPEVAALIRLARFGAPYQYKQPHRADRILRTLWTANVFLRLILNKVTFGLVQPACIMLSQNKELTFRQVMRRADLTSALLKTVVLGGLGGLWVKQRFGFGPFLKMLMP